MNGERSPIPEHHGAIDKSGAMEEGHLADPGRQLLPPTQASRLQHVDETDQDIRVWLNESKSGWEQQPDCPEPLCPSVPYHPATYYTYDFDTNSAPGDEPNYLDIKLWERDPPFFSSRDSGYGSSSRRSSMVMIPTSADSTLDFDGEVINQEKQRKNENDAPQNVGYGSDSRLRERMSLSATHVTLTKLFSERLALLDSLHCEVPCESCRRDDIVCEVVHPYMTWRQVAAKRRGITRGYPGFRPSCAGPPSFTGIPSGNAATKSAKHLKASASPLVPSSPSTSAPLSESESEPAEKSLIEERKKQIIDEVVAAATAWLRSRFDNTRFQNAIATRAGKGSSEGPCSESSSSRSQPSSSHQRKQGSSSGEGKASHKRKASTKNDEDGDDDEGGKEGPPPSKARIQKGKDVELLKFACPYFKYNQTKYKNWRCCPGPGWPDVHRVKEHLYRKHRQPKYRCVRCWQPFEDQQTHMDHQRNLMSCDLKSMEPIEGFDGNQETRLRSRKRSQTGLGEVDKWRMVFRILFPHVDDADIPSPFYEYEEESGQNPLSECEEYVVKEVPLRLRHILTAELDRDLNVFQEGLKLKAVDALKTILADVFREFRQRKQTTDDDAPSSSGHAAPAAQSGRQSGAYIEARIAAGDQVEVEVEAEAEVAQNDNFPDPDMAEGQPMGESGGPAISYDSYGFDLQGIDFVFLSNPENFLGEGPIMESLLQPFDALNQGGGDHAGDKKFSDSGYDSGSNSPPRLWGDSFEG